MRTIDKEQLRQIAYGACLMGSGGGGSLSMALAMIDALDDDWTAQVVTVDEAADDEDKEAVAVALAGAPSSKVDEHAALTPLQTVLTSLEYMDENVRKFKGRSIGYIVPIELGAVSTVVACLVAATKKLPVVDADGAGRAVPLLTMSTFYTPKGKTGPSVVTCTSGESLVMIAPTLDRLQFMFESIVGSPLFGGFAGITVFPMAGERLRRRLPIRGSLELTQNLGAVMLSQPENPVQTVIETFNRESPDRHADILATGILEGVDLKSLGGHDFVSLHIKTEVDGKAHQITIYAENENLIAWRDSQTSPMIMAPDSISFLNARGEPVTNAMDHAGLMKPVKAPPKKTVEQAVADSLRAARSGKQANAAEFLYDLYRPLQEHELAVIGITASPHLQRQEWIRQAFRQSLSALGYPGPHVHFENAGCHRATDQPKFVRQDAAAIGSAR